MTGCLNRQMPYLDPDDGRFIDEWKVLAHVRAAKPCAGRITAMLVPELATEHEYLLASKVGVRLEAFARRPLDQGDMFATKLVQWHDLEASLSG